MSFCCVKQAKNVTVFNEHCYNEKIIILAIDFSLVTSVACSSLSLVESKTMSLWYKSLLFFTGTYSLLEIFHVLWHCVNWFVQNC